MVHWRGDLELFATVTAGYPDELTSASITAKKRRIFNREKYGLKKHKTFNREKYGLKKQPTPPPQ